MSYAAFGTIPCLMIIFFLSVVILNLSVGIVRWIRGWSAEIFR